MAGLLRFPLERFFAIVACLMATVLLPVVVRAQIRYAYQEGAGENVVIQAQPPFAPGGNGAPPSPSDAVPPPRSEAVSPNGLQQYSPTEAYPPYNGAQLSGAQYPGSQYANADFGACFEEWDAPPPLPPLSPKPPLYFQASFTPLFRDSEKEPKFQTVGPQGDFVLGTKDLDIEFRGGANFLLGYQYNNYLSFEISFLGFYDYSNTATAKDFSLNALGTQGNLFSPFSRFGSGNNSQDFNIDGGPLGVVGLDYNRSAQITLQSTFDSASVNGYVDLPPVGTLETALSFGGRFVVINENMTYHTQSPEPAPVGSAVLIQNAVKNNLYGMQVGLEAKYSFVNVFWLDFNARGAFFYNGMQQNLSYEQTQGGAAVANFDGQDNLTKTVIGGDLNLTFNYLLTPHTVVRLGYQSHWFDGLALAANNIIPDGMRIQAPPGGPNTLVFPPLEINHSGQLVYHGPIAGVVIIW